MTDVYYLSSLESHRFEQVRECRVVKNLSLESGRTCILVKIDPVVIGQDFGLGSDDIEFLVLSNRHEGNNIHEINDLPFFVYIARPLIEGIEYCDEIVLSDIEVIAWGELYPTRHAAGKHIFN